MNNFQVFDNFRVNAWLSEGLINAAGNVVKAVKSTAARAGVVGVFVASASAAVISVAPNAPDNQIGFVHSLPLDQSLMHSSRTVLPSMDGELDRLRINIANGLRGRHEVQTANFDASTLESADRALARINADMPVFSDEWLEMISSGKA